MAPSAKRILAILPLLMFLSASVRAQTAAKATERKTAVQPAKYPDSADGLKLLLQDVFASAKLGGNPKLAAFVEDMEIPDYAEWFPKAFGKETGDAWSTSYESALDLLNVQLQALLIRLAGQNPEIVTRKVTGAPQSDSEKSALELFQQPVDVFFAGSRPRPGASGEPASASDASITPLGYFWFIGGKFRWDPMSPIGTFSALPAPDGGSSPGADSSASLRGSAPIPPGVLQPGQNGVGYPSCLECPAPVYTAAALAAKFQGTVKLQAVIQPDGTATNIEVVQGAPYDLDANAVDAVKHWRFNPAIGPNGKPVAVIAPIEVAYAFEPPSADSAPPSSLSPAESLVERAREAAFEFSEKLPNFICEEVYRGLPSEAAKRKCPWTWFPLNSFTRTSRKVIVT